MSTASRTFYGLLCTAVLLLGEAASPRPVYAGDSFAYDPSNDAIDWCDTACMNGTLPEKSSGNEETGESDPLSPEEQAELQGELGQIQESQAQQAAQQLDQVFAAMLRLNEEMLRDSLRRLERLQRSHPRGIFAEELLKHPFFRRHSGRSPKDNANSLQFEFRFERR